MKIMRRIFCLLLCLICATSMVSTFAYADDTSKEQPMRYTGISSIAAGLTIDSAGCATCTSSVITYSGYSVDLKMELQRDGSTIKTWLNSGSVVVSLSKPYYVTSGHSYQVIATATVYDSNGVYVATYSRTSGMKSY